MLQCQKILAIPQRRHLRPTVAYLSKEELAEVLAQPDLKTPEGPRDAVLLSILYDTGARVQELIDLSVVHRTVIMGKKMYYVGRAFNKTEVGLRKASPAGVEVGPGEVACRKL